MRGPALHVIYPNTVWLLFVRFCTQGLLRLCLDSLFSVSKSGRVFNWSAPVLFTAESMLLNPGRYLEGRGRVEEP